MLAVLAAVGLAAFNLVLLVALRHADAPLVATVLGCAPLALAVIGPLQRGHSPAARVVGSAAVVVAGTAIVYGGGGGDALGIVASAAALVGDVAFSLIAAALTPRLGATRVAAYTCALAVPILAAFSIATGEASSWRTPTPTEAGVLAFLAIIFTGCTFVTWFYGMQLLGVERAGMLTGLLPLTAVVVAAAQASQAPPAGQIAGVFVVAAGLTAGLSTTRTGAAGRRAAVPGAAGARFAIRRHRASRVGTARPTVDHALSAPLPAVTTPVPVGSGRALRQDPAHLVGGSR